MKDRVRALFAAVRRTRTSSCSMFSTNCRKRYPPDIDRPTLAGPAVRRGKAIVVPDVPDERIDEFARDADHAALTRRLGLRSYIVVPLATLGSCSSASLRSCRPIAATTRRTCPSPRKSPRRTALALGKRLAVPGHRTTRKRTAVSLPTLEHFCRRPATTRRRWPRSRNSLCRGWPIGSPST